MNKFVFSLLAVSSLVLTVVRFLPDDVQQKIPGMAFGKSPVQEVESALRKRSQELLKASATQQAQVARLKQTEAELQQVVKSKDERLTEIEFLIGELQKSGHSDVVSIHNVSLRKQDVQADLEALVLRAEELVKREELLKGLIARLQETTIQAAEDLATARGDLLTAENFLNEKKADIALAEVRRWSGSNEDPLVRIAAGEDELQEARRRLERELAESGIAPTEPGRPWSRWSNGHVTSAAEIQARANKLLAGEADKSRDSLLTAGPTQD